RSRAGHSVWRGGVGLLDTSPPCGCHRPCPCAASGVTRYPIAIPSSQLLLLQITIILVAARVLGLAFRRIGQPQVVGEMTAGILLGPTLFGRIAPETFHALFPSSGLDGLS